MPHKSHPYYDPNIDRKGFVPPKVYRSKNNQTIIHFHKKWENIVNNSKLKDIGYWCKDSKINTEELTNLIIKELSLDDFNIRSTTDLWISHL